jgi:predicted nucleotidyltransferase
MDFGLKDFDLDYITQAIGNFSEIEKAVIFGSRAKGTYKAGSDIDIAIFGEEITFSILAKLHSELEENSPMPYLFDIVDYTHSNHKELKEHILRAGKVIYERK